MDTLVSANSEAQQGTLRQMKRVVILGRGESRRPTLAKRLAVIAELPVVKLDGLLLT
jgi:hypothetical protein